MRGSGFISFILILAISAPVWTGCGGSPAPPADSGTIIEEKSELPGANQPYPMEKLGPEKSPEKTPDEAVPEAGSASAENPEAAAAESKTERDEAKPVEDKTD